MSNRTKSPSGIGRGNGPGSRRTQFQSGMPSANRAGRPRCLPNTGSADDMRSSFMRLMKQPVIVNVDGVRRQMSRTEVLARQMFDGFRDSTPHGRIALLKYIYGDQGFQLPPADRDLPAEAVAEFVEGIAAELRAAGRFLPDNET